MEKRLSFLVMAMFAFMPTTWAAESTFDFVKCSGAKLTPMNVGGDVTASGMENWGVVASSTTKEFENNSTHCLGFFRNIGGKRGGKGMCKLLDPAGNTALAEWAILAPGEGSWEFLAGTGTFKGISGTGQWKILTTAKPSAEGTLQFCERVTGKYTLP